MKFDVDALFTAALVFLSVCAVLVVAWPVIRKRFGLRVQPRRETAISETEATSAPAPRGRQTHFPVWGTALLLFLATIVLYWPAMSYGFVDLDDAAYVTGNSHVQGGLTWDGVKWAFRNTEQGSYWAPVMWLSHMFACQLFGLNAWGHHLINVLLHATNTALVFLVFRRMTQATWRSAILAALFGLHPLRVESVVWVTERKDVLSSLFWLLTMWAYLVYVERRAQARVSKSRLWYGTALVMFALGLMSKAMLVTVPCVLLLLDYWPLERFKQTSLRWLVAEKIPFFVLAVAASVITFVVVPNGGLSAATRIGNALMSYGRYVRTLFWPTGLAVFYPIPDHWPMTQLILAGGLLLTASILVFAKRRTCPYLLMGWLWYCGTLVPVSGLAQSGEQAMADRFSYIPSLGILVMVIWGAYELAHGWRYHVAALRFGAAAAIVLCTVSTRRQIGYWKDDETLARHAIEVTENNYLAHNILADALDGKGRPDEAIDQYREAIRLRPGYVYFHNNLGTVLAEKGQLDDAIREFRETVRLDPGYADAHYNLASALSQKGQPDEAIRHYREAIRLKPDYAQAHNNLGAVLASKGQLDEAIREFQEALSLDPRLPGVNENLARAQGTLTERAKNANKRAD